MKYTEDNVKAFITAIRMGVKIKIACDVIGISQDTYFTWKKEYPDFADTVKRVQAERVQEALAVIRKAALKQWTAAAWYLERTFPDQYGLKTQVTSINTGDEDAQLKERAKRLTKRMNEIIEEHVKVLATAGKNGPEAEVPAQDVPQLPNSNGNGSEPKQDIVLE